jgi:hypothetical protein
MGMNLINLPSLSPEFCSLFPSIYDWVVNVSGTSPIQGDFGENIKLPGLDNWYGVLAWKRGALLVSFVWVAMLVMVIDRRWAHATFWAGLAAFFAVFGIIHVPEAGFENFNNPVWEQCKYDADASQLVCWEFAKQWMHFVGYVMLMATFAIIGLCRKYGIGLDVLLPEIEDQTTQEAFQDWFKDAAVESHPNYLKPGTEPEFKDPDPTTKTIKGKEDEGNSSGEEVGEA